LPGRISAVDDSQCEQRPANRPDDRMQAIPDGVEPRNFVGEKLCNRAKRTDAKHPRVGKNIKHLQIFRQRHDVEMHRYAGRENGQVKSPA